MPARLAKIRKSLVLVGMLVPVVLLIGVGCILHRSHQAMLASNHLVAHTLEVESKLARLRSHLAEAESAQRGYILTQRHEFIESFTAAVGRVAPEEKELLALTVDNPSQQQRLKKLAEAIAAKIDVLQRGLSLTTTAQHDEAVKIMNTGGGRELMTEIHRLITAAAAEEEVLLRTREKAMAEKGALNAEVSYALIAFAGATALGVLMLLWRFQRAQALVTVCAWSKTIEHQGEWLSFEDYLEKRFGFNISHGISPEEAAKFTENLAQRRKQQQENSRAAV